MNNQNKQVILNIIGAVESGGQIYGNRRYDAYAGKFQNSKKELTCTLGWNQSYGYEAMELVKRIYNANTTEFRNVDTANIEKMLNKDWVDIGWNPNPTQKDALIKIITTSTGKKIQDEYALERINKYIKRAEDYGVIDIGAQMMWCEIQHLGGLSAVTRIFDKTKTPYTVDSIYLALMSDQNDTSNNNQVGDKIFQSRHNKCVEFIKRYSVPENTVSLSISKEIKGDFNMESTMVINTLKNWLGYIEKASNSQLDNKTANRGSANYNRFSRIIDVNGLMGCQGQAWCGSFQFGCEIESYGVEQALKNWGMSRSNYVGYNCFATYNSFARRGKVTRNNPKVGDLVVFTFSHIGRVVKRDGSKIWTIEGNTSPNAYDRNGGMVAMKSYNIGDSKIKGFCIIDYDTTSNNSHTNTSSTITRDWLQLGDKGSQVKELQSDLNYLGYSIGNVDGDFGSKTENAVKAIQTYLNKADKNIKIDGQYGKLTKAKVKYLVHMKNLQEQERKKAVVKTISSITSKVNGLVSIGQKWMNDNYSTVLKKANVYPLVVDNSYGQKSNYAAIAIWKDIANRKYGATLTISNNSFGSSCKSQAKSMIIKLNSTGTLVYLIQFILAAKGYYTGKLDGEFGNGTFGAVIAFQKKHNLYADGEVGANTWFELFNS